MYNDCALFIVSKEDTHTLLSNIEKQFSLFYEKKNQKNGKN